MMLDLGKVKGVKANTAHSEVDKFMTKTYVMPLLFDDESRRRIIAEHRNSPVGSSSKNGKPAVEHSHELRTVLDKMRRQPMTGKYVSVCLRMFEEYKVGISSGVRGEPVKTFEEIYSSEEACEHAIFLKRISDLMENYK